MSLATENPTNSERLFSRGYVLAFLATLSFYVATFLIVIATPLYAKHIGANALEIGVVMSSFNITCAIVRFLAGRAIDVRGRKSVMLFGALVLTTSAILFNWVDSVPWLIALRAFQGIGLPTFSSAAATYIADISPIRRRGEALGYYNVTWGITQGLAPPLSIALVFSSGFTSVFLATALAAFVAFVIVLPLAETRAKQPHLEGEEKATVIHPKAIFPAIVWFCQGIAMASVNFFLPLYALEAEVGNPGLFFTLFALVSIPVTTFAGRLSDRYGRSTFILPGLTLSAISMTMLAFAPSPLWFLAAALILGFGPSMAQPALFAFTLDRVGTEKRGAAVSTFQASFDVAYSVGPVGLGQMAARSGYASMYLLSAITVLMGLTLFGAGAIRQRGVRIKPFQRL